MFTSCFTLSFTVESMASNKVRSPVNLVAWFSLDRFWLLDQWNNVLQMNGDTTSECPIKPKWGCSRTSIDVLHKSMEVCTSKEVRTLICGRPPSVILPWPVSRECLPQEPGRIEYYNQLFCLCGHLGVCLRFKPHWMFQIYKYGKLGAGNTMPSAWDSELIYIYLIYYTNGNKKAMLSASSY